jgi:hypothetical protein
MTRSASIAASLLLALLAGAAWPKLPPPSEEAKAKAEEAKARAAHADKVAAYQLCQAMDRVAADYFAAAKRAGRTVPPPTPTPACVDPGPFIAPPPAAAKS